MAAKQYGETNSEFTRTIRVPSRSVEPEEQEQVQVVESFPIGIKAMLCYIKYVEALEKDKRAFAQFCIDNPDVPSSDLAKEAYVDFYITQAMGLKSILSSVLSQALAEFSQAKKQFPDDYFLGILHMLEIHGDFLYDHASNDQIKLLILRFLVLGRVYKQTATNRTINKLFGITKRFLSSPYEPSHIILLQDRVISGGDALMAEVQEIEKNCQRLWKSDEFTHKFKEWSVSKLKEDPFYAR